MIYTCTFNPSIDYEMEVEQFALGKTNRSSNECYRLGGKGINVSAVLKNLGVESIALGFVGGFIGEQIIKMMHEADMNEDMIDLKKGISRINVKMRGRQETELNAQGPLICDADMKKLYEQLDRLTNTDMLILSGSVPPSLKDHIYEQILERLKGRNVTCIVDASGSLLAHSLKMAPFLIKPNMVECESILHEKLRSDAEIVSAAKKLQTMGARNVLISLGKEGAILVDEQQQVYQSRGLKGKCISSVGCGDSMVAGFAAAFAAGAETKEAFRLAMACGTATAFSEGLAEMEMIKECYNKMEVAK